MIRELDIMDLDEDYFSLLCQLSGKPQELRWQTVYRFWSKYEDNEDHIILVYTTPLVVNANGETDHKDRIVGTASVLIENKLLHYGSQVGHIEDVVTDQSSRGLGVGKQLIKECVHYCRMSECYKVILDCSKENIPFYEECGFHTAEHCMGMDIKR